MIRTMLSLAPMVAALLLAPGQALAAKRVALVIGNAAYEHTLPLANPANDARLIAERLADHGFEVMRHADLGYRPMKRAVQAFTSKLEEYGKDTIGLIYFAGHGLQLNGQNFLVPVDARIGKEGDIELEAISADALLSGVSIAGNRLNIVILDACRNNPFRGMFRSVSRGLARLDAPVGSLIAFSTAPGMVAADGEGANSPYTEALAAALTQPGLKLEDVFKAVRRQVYASTKGLQVPWESSSVFGDFYFSPPPPDSIAAPEPPRPALPPIDDRAIELAFWRSIEDSDTKGAFEAYLAQYPKGEFVALASLKIEALTRAEEEIEAAARTRREAEPREDGRPADEPVAAAPAGGLGADPAGSQGADARALELAYWNSIKDSDSAAEFQSYLQTFPDGVFMELARLRLAMLTPPGVPARPPASVHPFDGAWHIDRQAPSCRANPSAKFSITVADGKVKLRHGDGSVAANGAIRLTVVQPDGRRGTFVGKVTGDRGSGRFTGSFRGRTCSGTFTITRLDRQP